MSEPHFDAVRQMLRTVVPAGTAIHDTDASAVAGKVSAYPYLVISGGVPEPEYEALGACSTGAQGLLRVTHVALAPGAVRAMVASSRLVLDRRRLPIPGGLELRLEDSQGVLVDRDVAIVSAASTTSWPFYAVDIYRVRSTA